MEFISFKRLFMAVTLILLYVVHRLVGLSHQASPLNLKQIHEHDLDVRHLAFEDQLQFIDTDDYKTEKFFDDIQLDSISVSYLSVSVLLFELNERHGCLEAANYSVIRTFSAVNVGQMVLKVRGFRFGSSSSASNILRGRLYNIAKSTQQQQKSLNHYASNDQPDNTNRQLKHQQINNNQFESDKAIEEQSVCQGYGFTIFDCEPFDLEPNHEHKIRIAFSPDFTLTKTIVSLTILTNLDKEFKFALVASIPRNLLASCNRSLPRPEWEPTMHLILAFGMVVMILVSVLIAYMEAILYLRSQQTATTHGSINQAVTQNNSHNGGSNKDYDRTTNCSSHSIDACNKDRSNGSGHGATAISASISSNHNLNAPSLNALSNNNKINNNQTTTPSNKNVTTLTSANNKSNNNNCTQKRRKNSNANSEKVPTSNNNSKSTSSSLGDKKSTSPYAPIFQNLTNVIASPPPPLPTFDSEFDSPEFRKLRNKKSAKKPNSSNGSVAGSDDVGNSSSISQSQTTTAATTPTTNVNNTKTGSSSSSCKTANTKPSSQGLKSSSGINSINGFRDSDMQTPLDQTGRLSRSGSQDRKLLSADQKSALTTASVSGMAAAVASATATAMAASVTAATSTVTPSNITNNIIINGNNDSNIEPRSSGDIKLYSRVEIGKDQQGQTQNPPMMPIQPPSTSSASSSSTSSSSSSTPSTASTVSSSTPSSTSSSPPLSVSSYGEYSLLGPGATFELPCLRVRSAQT